MSKITELFGYHKSEEINWQEVVEAQRCPFLAKKCIKVRKSQPEVSIGTCTVGYGGENQPVVICPHRLRERQQVFTDCLHLLTLHEPGNELHLVPEITEPGGSVDYFLVSSARRKVRDFVGVELQTLDTTGTVWPERQRFLQEKGVPIDKAEPEKSFGMNWKMTAKTILVQLHHKIQTFEHLSKHLVLVVQDRLADYMRREFDFGHIGKPLVGHPMHFHSYRLVPTDHSLSLELADRFSTDTAGIERCLGLQADAKVELKVIFEQLEAKLSDATLIRIA